MKSNSNGNEAVNQQVRRKHNLSPTDHTPLDIPSIDPSQIAEHISERRRIIANLRKRIKGKSNSPDRESTIVQWNEILAKHERDLNILLEREISLFTPKTKKRRIRIHEDSDDDTSRSSTSMGAASFTVPHNHQSTVSSNPPESEASTSSRSMDNGSYTAALQSFGIDLDLSGLFIKTRSEQEVETLRNERKGIHTELMSKISEPQCDYKLLIVPKGELVMTRENEINITNLLSSEIDNARKMENSDEMVRFEHEHLGSQQGGIVIKIKTPHTYALLKAASETGNFYVTTYPSVASKGSLSVSVPFGNVSPSDTIKLIGKSEYDFKSWTYIRPFRNPAPNTSRHFFLIGKDDVVMFARKHITQSFRGRSNAEYALINERTPSGAVAHLSIKSDQLQAFTSDIRITPWIKVSPSNIYNKTLDIIRKAIEGEVNTLDDTVVEEERME